MLSNGIIGDFASVDNSKTVLFAKPVDYLPQPSPTESEIVASPPSVTEYDVAFKFSITDDFEKLKAETNFELPLSEEEHQSHGTVFSPSDCVESSRNGFVVNSSQNIFDVHAESSEAVLLQDRNFLNISTSSWQSNNSTREKDDLNNMEKVEELFDLFVTTGETEDDVLREEPLFSLLDVFCPMENQETSLFPPTVSFSSAAITDCADKCDNVCSSILNYSEKSLASYAVHCSSNLRGHFSNETTTLDCTFDNLLNSDTPSDALEPSLQQSEYSLGSMPTLQCPRVRARDKRKSSRKRGRSRMKRKTVRTEAKVLSVSEVQRNSLCFESLSKQKLLYPLSKKASKQVQLAASGNGFVSEFAKFIASNVGSHKNALQASESPPQYHESRIQERQTMQNCVTLKTKEDSLDCLMDSSFTTSQTSSKRRIQKPACACCMKTSKVNTRKRRTCLAKHESKIKDTKISRQLLQYTNTVDAYTSCQEQLDSLQCKLYCLLHILFPFLLDWQFIRPHSHSLVLLVDDITDSLRNSSGKINAGVLQRCCPLVTLCRFPARCLRSLQRKATVLVNLLIPSLCIGDMEHDQLEAIIDQLILSNANVGYANQL